MPVTRPLLLILCRFTVGHSEPTEPYQLPDRKVKLLATLSHNFRKSSREDSSRNRETTRHDKQFHKYIAIPAKCLCPTLTAFVGVMAPTTGKTRIHCASKGFLEDSKYSLLAIIRLAEISASYNSETRKDGFSQNLRELSHNLTPSLAVYH